MSFQPINAQAVDTESDTREEIWDMLSNADSTDHNQRARDTTTSVPADSKQFELSDHVMERISAFVGKDLSIQSPASRKALVAGGFTEGCVSPVLHRSNPVLIMYSILQMAQKVYNKIVADKD